VDEARPWGGLELRSCTRGDLEAVLESFGRAAGTTVESFEKREQEQEQEQEQKRAQEVERRKGDLGARRLLLARTRFGVKLLSHEPPNDLRIELGVIDLHFQSSVP
jgi:GAF domain-containing protein